MTATASNGTLYIVATPIGHLEDISTRALQTLKSVSCIAAEDTRHSKTLLQYWQIDTPLLAYHSHNEAAAAAKLIARLQAGDDIALISDAGTPLISDPGYSLVILAHQHHIKITPIPGPCSLITALCAAGLPTQNFCFQGFLPQKSTARLTALQLLEQETRTLIFYEAPHRIMATLAQMIDIFGAERLAALGRELTKKHETISRGSLKELYSQLNQHPEQQRGEFVVMIAGKTDIEEENTVEAQRLLAIFLPQLPLKQAVALTVEILACRKKPIYDLALSMQANDSK